MSDFIFGTLATDALRLAHVRAQRGGVTHAHARLPRDPLPGQDIAIELWVGPAFPFELAWVYWTTDGSDPQGKRGQALRGQVTAMQVASMEWDTLLWGYRRCFRAVLPGQPNGTVLRYRIGTGMDSLIGEDEVYADNGAFYACYIADDPTPLWTRDAVVYQIFVDRFNPGYGRAWKNPEKPSGFFGGTLRGITEKLDYLAGLGANVLWLTPIFPSPSHHGYDATDYFEIEPRLGTKADFRVLLDTAHAMGIRVLLDFVPNHWSHLHATFQQAIANPDSPYRQWYSFRRWPDEYETFFGVRTLPQVNLRHPPARQHILEAVAYWLDFGVDGYRVDYAIGPTPDFWADFRRVTHTKRPDGWTFGEVVDPPDSQVTFEGGLDGCLDFVLLEALRQTFAYGQWDGVHFVSFLDRHEAFFPESFSRPSFLDNHDMNRFLWAARGDERRLRLAALCQFTLAGPPVIYYGTEVGLSQQRDVRQGDLGLPEEARLPMLWGDAQDPELLAYYCQLVTLRHAHPALRYGTREVVHVDGDTLTYVREHEKDCVAVFLNLSQGPRQVSVSGLSKGLIFTTDPNVTWKNIKSGVQVDLPPLGGVALAMNSR